VPEAGERPAAPAPPPAARGRGLWIGLLVAALLAALLGLAGEARRASRLEARLAETEGRLAAAQARLSAYDAYLGAVRARFGALRQQLDGLAGLLAADPAEGAPRE
jgi:hypothetical protein